ncbi:hypothetical protein NC652_026719 [Populus alba x Populus x berolinensis]|uniref:Uncharacterized protein n=1 Tax=Populus alba x Populus x berolinensis TaxID=444605 RepID=A0AAD6MDB2_9ROSI|nr:hypothetical protein NC652_026719 [Populus alba x Populus x berolinensis]KAJ6983433.1 hypothetical protein NC653_026290 [Populus alba x Populus x berolinensis]
MEEDSKGSPLGLEKRVESTNKSRKTLQDKQLTTARRGSWFRVVFGDWAPLNGTLKQSSKRARENTGKGQEEFSVCLKHNSFSANEIFSNAKGFLSTVAGWSENS